MRPRPVKASDPALALTAPDEVAAREGALTDLVPGPDALLVTVPTGVVADGPGGVVGVGVVVTGGAVVGGSGVVVGGGGGFFDGGPPPMKVIGIDGRSWAASKKRSEQVMPAVCCAGEGGHGKF